MANVTVSVDTTDVMVDAVVAFIDAGAGSSLLRIYSGFPPPSPESAPSGVLLAQFTLPSPSFDPAVSGVAELSAPLTATAAANGEAGWFRIVNGDGDAVVDGRVGELGDGRPLEMNVREIASGFPVDVTTLELTVPTNGS